MRTALLLCGEQRCITSGRRRVDGESAFGRKAVKIPWASSLRPRARKPFAPERLHPNNRPDRCLTPHPRGKTSTRSLSRVRES